MNITVVRLFFAATMFVSTLGCFSAVVADSCMEYPTVVAVAQSQHCDSIYQFRAGRVVLPAALIAVGGFGVSNGAMHKLNNNVRNMIGGGEHHTVRVDEVLPYLPAAAVYGLDLCGMRARHGVKERTILLVLSNVIAQGLSRSTKAVVSELRPDGSNRNSFPSGHTTMAFANAEMLRREYGDVSSWITVAGYCVATVTGAMRMYNDKHWFNDVLAGAGMGILGTRIAYWIYPWVEKHLVARNKEGSVQAVVMPCYMQLEHTGVMAAGIDNRNRTIPVGSCGVMFAISF